MLTPAELEILLRDLESDRIERTASQGKTDKFAEAVCAFANDLPPVRYKGQIWIRVGPRRGIATEQEERLLTERRVARAHSFDVTPVQGAEVA